MSRQQSSNLSKILRKIPWALAGFCLLTGALAHAASFDCGMASTRMENLVCDNADLSKLDEDLAAAYKVALRDKKRAESIRRAQREWLKLSSTCIDADCVLEAYEARLQELALYPEEAAAKAKQKPRFTVTQGKGWTVCEDYVKFLNSLPESEPLPLCHLKLSPDFPDLKEPDWEEIDILSHLDLVYALEKLTSPSEHDRPVNSFNHWKAVFEQQFKTGEVAPRLRRVRLALIGDGPVETILAYEPDRDSCDKEVKKNGYAFEGARTNLFIWDEQEKKIKEYTSHIVFPIPYELRLFQGKPLLFWSWWGDVDGRTRYVAGRILVKHFIATGASNSYGNVHRCQIGFELPSEISERMLK